MKASKNSIKILKYHEAVKMLKKVCELVYDPTIIAKLEEYFLYFCENKGTENVLK